MAEEKKTKGIKQLKGRVETSLSGFFRCCIVALLVAAQFAILLLLPLWLREYTVYFYTIMELFSFAFILIVTNDQKSMSYKIAWFCIVLILPVSGFVMYALWGKTGKNNKLQKNVLKKLSEGKNNCGRIKKCWRIYGKSNP